MQPNLDATRIPASDLFDVATRRIEPHKSYRDVLNARKSFAAIGQIGRTSDNAEPGHIVMFGNGSRGSFVVGSER